MSIHTKDARRSTFAALASGAEPVAVARALRIDPSRVREYMRRPRTMREAYIALRVEQRQERERRAGR